MGLYQILSCWYGGGWPSYPSLGIWRRFGGSVFWLRQNVIQTVLQGDLRTVPWYDLLDLQSLCQLALAWLAMAIGIGDLLQKERCLESFPARFLCNDYMSAYGRVSR